MPARMVGAAARSHTSAYPQANHHQKRLVSERSADEVERRVRSHSIPKDPEAPTDLETKAKIAACKLQAVFRSKRLYRQRLHRDNLSQRLLFEWSLLYGAMRLFNQIAVFALLLIAVQLSGDSRTKRGIYHNLKDHFDFDELTENAHRSDIRPMLQELSVKSKDFFLLSSQYFEPEDMGGTVELIGDMEPFSQYKVIGGVQLSITIPDFSFTCWVKTVRQFKRGYIIRKRITPSGSGTGLACWGWHLTESGGASLHYGGHDFYSTSEISGGSRTQEVVELSDPKPFVAHKFTLLTVVVREISENKSVAFFYRNLEEIGNATLPRPITDCFNNQEGVLVGDAGMTLGQLRFYPRAMTLSSIQEVYEGGSFLSDISTGSVPGRPIESEIEVMSRGLHTAFVNVEQGIADQHPRQEIDLVLQSVEAALSNQAPSLTSPEAPFGLTPIDPTLRADANGRQFTQLIEGPFTLSEPAPGDERYFAPAAFPDWSGRGVSFTMWYRHPECSIASCGTYLLSAHHEGAQSSARCWSLWVEDIAVYFDSMKSDPPYVYAVGVMERKFQISHNHWRHFTFVFDENTDTFLFYQDGDLVYTAPFGSVVKDANCVTDEMRITFGARFPAWSWGLEMEVYDMRAYVGAPLSAQNVYDLAFGRTDPLGKLAFPQLPGESDLQWGRRVNGEQERSSYRCTPLDSPIMKDKPWQDLYGHTCQWFHDNRDRFPGVCALPQARTQCPIACKSLQECYSNFKAPEPYFAWRSIRRIERRGAHGTVCLGDDMALDSVVSECRKWRAERSAGSDDLKVFEHEVETSNAKRVNLSDCEELAEAVDSACSYDAEEVRRFTAKAKESGGDYTIAFWIKPVGEESLFEGGRFVPHLQFINTLNPPRHNLGWGWYVESGNVGAARMTTACPRDGVGSESVETTVPLDSGWTFLALSRVNSTWNTTGSEGETATNLELVYENSGSFAQCLFDDSSLFSGIEVSFPALISPVMMVPAKLPFASVQEIYYSEWERMRVREGPLVTNREREVTSIPVEKKDYGLRSVLMAAPIIFSTRTQPNATCPYEYATKWLHAQHKAVVETQCAEPFACNEDILRSPSATMACSGGPQVSDPFFGLNPADFRGVLGFADLLFSITDSPFVFRGEELRSTSDFVDSQTRDVLVLLVFFTPEYGITTVMAVNMDMSGPQDLEVEVNVMHYSILEGNELRSYVIVQCMVLVSIGLMLLDVVWELRTLYRRRNDPEISMKQELFKHFTDATTVLAVTLFVALRLSVVTATARETERILGELTGIPWGSPTMPMREKKEVFFRTIEDLLDRIKEQGDLDSFLNVILIISLLRVIQCTSLHPRLALLTGTVAKAMDDFWHSALLIVLMMSSFALIGTWRFGDELEEFGDFERSMQTEVELMFGEFIDTWRENRELQAFVMLYYMVMFMLVLNFLLAIIVEAYMGVRKEVEICEVEEEFLTDLFNTFYGILMARWYGWPSTSDLGKLLSRMDAKYSIGFMDLYHLDMFDSQHKIGRFLQFYSRYDFLEPPHITAQGRVVRHDDSESLEDRIVKRVCEVLEIKPRRLKDMAVSHQLVAQARSHHGATLASVARSARTQLEMGEDSGQHRRTASEDSLTPLDQLRARNLAIGNLNATGSGLGGSQAGGANRALALAMLQAGEGSGSGSRSGSKEVSFNRELEIDPSGPGRAASEPFSASHPASALDPGVNLKVKAGPSLKPGHGASDSVPEGDRKSVV